MNDNQLVENAVSSLVKGNKVFTAWNVTQQVRAHGASQRHGALKHVVHAVYENGGMPGYLRVLVTLPGKEPSWLYFPDGYNVDNFKGQIDQMPTPPAPPTDDDDDDDEEDSNDGNPDEIKRSMSQDGILYIPNGWVREINSVCGNELGLLFEMGHMSLSEFQGVSGDDEEIIHVDPHDNARIYARMLRRHGINNTTFILKRSATSKEVIIVPA